MTNVEIEYCVPCGNLPHALGIQEEILDTLGQEVDRVALKTGDSGVFKVRIDGQQVYDKREDDEGFDVEELIDDIRARASA